MARPKKPQRKPVTEQGFNVADREGYASLLIAELDETTGDTARARLLDMLGKVYRHFDSPLPGRAPPVPHDPRKYLEWMRSRVRRAMIAKPEHTARLVAQDVELTSAIKALPAGDDVTPAEMLAMLIAGLPDWSDEEMLAAHAEGLRRGIPGFAPRG